MAGDLALPVAYILYPVLKTRKKQGNSFACISIIISAHELNVFCNLNKNVGDEIHG